MHLKHILVPVDFSEGTQEAISSAAELARKFSARVSLLHVCEFVYPPIDEPWFTEGAEVEAMHADAEVRLGSLAASMGAGVQSAAVIEPGTPWDCIVKHAARNDANLIIMPTHGRSGLNHILLGSVAERVVQHAPCPVMVVRCSRKAAASV